MLIWYSASRLGFMAFIISSCSKMTLPSSFSRVVTSIWSLVISGEIWRVWVIRTYPHSTYNTELHPGTFYSSGFFCSTAFYIHYSCKGFHHKGVLVDVLSFLINNPDSCLLRVLLPNFNHVKC